MPDKMTEQFSGGMHIQLHDGPSRPKFRASSWYIKRPELDIRSTSARSSSVSSVDAITVATGQRAFAQLCAQKDDFFVIRRFDELHCRVILALQDSISNLQEELDLLEYGQGKKTPPPIEKEDMERKLLLTRIAGELKKYDDAINAYMKVKNKPTASTSMRQYIQTWLSNNNGPLTPTEAEFLDSKDLIVTTKSPKSTLRYFLQHRVQQLVGWLAEATGHAGKIDPVTLTAWIFLFAATLAFFIAPLWILSAVKDTTTRLIVISTFIMAFLGVIAGAIVPKPSEALAATAAYAAVLAVFLLVSAVAS